MTPTSEGSVRLFRLRGIDVFLHWSWLFVVFYFVQTRKDAYSSPVWAVWECIALFTIVLLHEFGHAFATRQVGGTADTIVLWPFGGVAYCNAPPRPGAHLWSIVAGPLVNVVLVPFLYIAYLIAEQSATANVASLLGTINVINLGLLVFNMLPIYPLDGGQTLRTLLWFAVGPARSLLWTAAFGFLGAAALAWLAIQERMILTAVIAFMIFMSCRSAWMRAREALALQSPDQN